MIIYFLLIVCFIHDNSSISFVSFCNYDGLILFKGIDYPKSSNLPIMLYYAWNKAVFV